jgi:predicted unusual protein kinase regulating ubiquinone biosynthesis (AarF/ABC1/UbiB family)
MDKDHGTLGDPRTIDRHRRNATSFGLPDGGDSPPPQRAGSPSMPAAIDPRRYRKLRRFVVRTLVAAFFWDVLLARPGLSWLRSPPIPRWRRVAARYRDLAAEMGGLLIKLGQFLSVRVDLLPAEVIGELAGLQDEVAPEPLPRVLARIAEEFGRPAHRVFEAFEPLPIGAASLAQVHRARLPGGREVVVKVLRPGIEVLVDTDLAAIALALRLLRRWRRLRERVDLPSLAAEIASTTRAELDLEAEGENATRFRGFFADDPGIRVPQTFPEHSTRRVLTLEDVGYLKIGDIGGLERAGIDPKAVASRIYRAYMRQIFELHFVHADPHPGNLFVRPLPLPGEETMHPGGPPPEGPPDGSRPFELAFVDFGMVATVPERLRDAVREHLIGLATRDAARLVRSYVAAGVLRPGADVARLEAIHEELFQRFWGVRLGDLRETALSQASYFLREYRDLLLEVPFQVQVELLFVGRAVGLLSGLATRLDPAFDPWAETAPYASRLAADEVRQSLRPSLLEAGAWLVALAQLPQRLARLADRAERGSLTVRMAPTLEARRSLERIERSVRRLTWTLAAAASLLSAALLRAASLSDPLVPWLFAAAVGFFGLGLLRGRP